MYSTGCPKCSVLKKKLEQSGLDFEIHTSVDEMLGLGIRSAPALNIEGEIFDFSAAIKWLAAKKE